MRYVDGDGEGVAIVIPQNRAICRANVVALSSRQVLAPTTMRRLLAIGVGLRVRAVLSLALIGVGS